VLRTVRNGRVRNVLATTYVEESVGAVVLYVPPGAEVMRASTSLRRGNLVSFDEPWEHEPDVWRDNHVLWLGRTDEPYALLLFWNGDWELLGWYVQLQDPLMRSPVGFDTRDHLLDVWVEPDGSWAWKDEDELALAVELGLFEPAEAKAARAAGEKVVAEKPWPTGWEDWRPEPAWTPPILPKGWNVV
jgi:Protein of unknown function (DUF402)